MGLVGLVAGLAQPWADLYSGSVSVEATVVFLHLAALVVAGGLAIASDRAIVRAAAAAGTVRTHVLQDVAGAHRLVIIGLAVLVATGMLMLLADVEALLPSWVFWVKMGLFGLLLWNGVQLRRVARAQAVDADPAGWRPLRTAAVRSSVLWLVLLLFGTLLPLVV
jgi:hypothetical protein